MEHAKIRKINLVLLIDVLQDTTGGAERQVFELAQRLDKKRFNVHLRILHQDYVPAEIKGLGIYAQALGMKRIYGLDGLRKGCEFARFLKKERIDVLMTYHFSSDLWGAYWGRKTNARIISNRRDEGFWKKWFHRLAYRLTNRRVDKICVVSKAVLRKVIAEEGISPQKVSLFYSGVDFNRFETKADSLGLKRKIGLTDTATIIGCVGNLKPVKGHKFLIEAAKEILVSFPDTHFVFAGEDEFEIKGTLEQEIQRNNVNSNVHLLGRRTDIPRLLQIMDICVLPSLSEGLSNTLLEYMAGGKPIVATNVGGNPELIHDNVNGLLVKKADAKDLAEKITYLLGNKEEKIRLGENAKQDVEKIFSIGIMVEKYEKLFAGLTGEINPAPAVILGMSANGLSIARTLGRKGIPVIGIDSNGEHIGRFSRYCKKHMICPNVIQKEEEFIEFLIGIGKKLRTKSVLFITSDEYIFSISKNREKMYPYFNFSLPEQWIVESFLDKRKSYDLAEKNGLSCPKTYCINEPNGLEKIINAVHYPCALKPVYSHLWRVKYGARKLVVVDDAKDMINRYNEIKNEGLQVMIQEIIPGKDDQFLTFFSYFNKQHKPLALFTKRKFRQYPIHYGNGTFHVSERNDEVINISLGFLSRIHYAGFVGIEFKRDSRDNKLKFIELNLRTLMSGELPIACGVDLPYIYYQDLIGGEVKEAYKFKEGVKLVNWELDAASFLKYKKLNELSFLEWIKSFRGKVIDENFTLDDPVPFMFICFRLIKTLGRKLKSAIMRNTQSKQKRNDTINLLHLISSNGLFGAEKVMLNIAQACNANGNKTWVAGLKNTRNPHEEIVEEAKKRNIRACLLESKSRFDFNAVNSLCRFIKKNKIGILHSHNYKANFIGLLAAKRAGIPIVATLHGYIGNGRKLRFYEALDRFILRYFNKVALVDDSLKKWFKNGGEKYEVINNGIEVNEFTNSRVCESSRSEVVIGTVGRLSEEKGHKYLLEAFAKFTKEFSQSKLLIVGDGELRKELLNLSEALGIKEKVTFTGYQEDVARYYSLIDIYASPSLVEHFPMSILEAMSFGKAVAATDVGGTSKMIVNGETGLIIKPHSSEEICQALFSLAKDSALRNKLSENARAFVKENYSLKKMINGYKKVYNEL